jgi:TolB protein
VAVRFVPGNRRIVTIAICLRRHHPGTSLPSPARSSQASGPLPLGGTGNLTIRRAEELRASCSSSNPWSSQASGACSPGSRVLRHPTVDSRAIARVRCHARSDDRSRSCDLANNRSGQADVWILDLATRGARNITAAPSGESRPAWSPDGQWIAFVSDRMAPRTSCVDSGEATGPGPFVTPQYTGVFVVRADGTSLRRISAATEVAGGPAWSTDGAKLVFHSAELAQVCNGGLMFANGTSQIAMVDLATGNRTVVTSGSGVKLFPKAIAATTIGYVTSSGLAFTGAAAPSPAGQCGRPSWSPGGQAMAFHRDVGRRGDPRHTVVPKAGRDPRFALLALAGHTSFSPDGK